MWNIQTNLINLIEGVKDIPEGIKRYIPSYEYEIYDFSPKSKAKIAGEAYTRLVIEVMRSAFEKDKERFYKTFKLMVELTNKMQDKEKVDEVFEICLKYLLDTKDDIEIEEMEKVAKEESVERGELIMSIAEKLREEGIKKGIEKGKLEERKEFTIKLLSKKFGVNLTEELKEKIRNADEKTINYIGDNLLEITLDELKDILE
ncbi:Rpn family recombination-promoting nuclease/putative transposase [Petrotoga sp. 9PWA.NaAc.5.4]|uniref:Rpn family recombination-promoting nuclease/putative transposase n=1 Tax=Petrotoga sp. 9PWA.NaAc.5.4 TaxID=1434328 RepID=UPI000EFB1C04